MSSIKPFQVTTVLFACTSVVGCASFAPPYSTDPAQYRAQVAPLIAEANARQAASMSTVTAAALENTRPIETRPFAAAPKLPGGPGFHCYSKRKRSTREDDSVCVRSSEECRVLAKRDARGGAFEVGLCQRQETATCHYVWSGESAGGHRCYATPSDCRPFMMSAGPIAQSECGDTR